MKKMVLLMLFTFLSWTSTARADMFGADVAVLAQILSNALEQLAQLRSILQNGESSLDLIRDINRGVNDSLALAKTISPNADPGLYKDWEKLSDALNKIEKVYGIVIDSPDQRAQRDADQSVAEAITLNNSIYKYTQTLDEIGEQIKTASHSVSPGGAAKLTAESIGVMLNVQNEMLRTQATGLKLQAQALALNNRESKERTQQMVHGADNINSALASSSPEFRLPRFE